LIALHAAGDAPGEFGLRSVRVSLSLGQTNGVQGELIGLESDIQTLGGGHPSPDFNLQGIQVTKTIVE